MSSDEKRSKQGYTQDSFTQIESNHKEKDKQDVQQQTSKTNINVDINEADSEEEDNEEEDEEEEEEDEVASADFEEDDADDYIDEGQADIQIDNEEEDDDYADVRQENIQRKSTEVDERDVIESITRNELLDEVDIYSDTNANSIEGGAGHPIVTNVQDATIDDIENENVSVTDVAEATNQLRNEVKSVAQWPKNKSYIEYEEDGIWKEAFVLSSQPKRNGKNKEWLNIHVTGKEEPRSIAWKEVNGWRSIKKHQE